VTVRVEEGRFADAVDLLRGLGYPRRQYSSLGDVFSGEGFVVSPLEERARLIYGLTEELARTISDVDGVLSARVHVVLPTSDRFSQDRTPSSAAVFIRHDGAIDLGPLVPQIKLLVANSIEGLGYEKVSVVLVPVSIAVPPATAGMAMGRNGPDMGMAPALVGAGLGGAGLAAGAGLLALRLRRSHAKAGEGTGLVTVPAK
jgi:type III secretion protein J